MMAQFRTPGLVMDKLNFQTVKPIVGKRKLFEKDFIILSEFSEQVGPVPVQFIPDEKSKGLFDASHFSVRIMTSDYQSPSGKLVGEDTQVLLSEKQDHVFAYVHYFSLNDINARGYVRQFCFSYITSKFSKLVDNFALLKKRFCEVTAMLKCGNHRVFKRDLEHHLADLKLTMAELEDEGWDKMEGVDNLYSGFDFTMEDVPERDPEQVVNATTESRELLEQLRVEMVLEENKQTWAGVKKLRRLTKNRHMLHVLKDKSPIARKVPGQKIGSPDSQSLEFQPASFSDSISSELTNSTSSDRSHYQPQRVMTHTVHKFERRLRPLEDLSPKAHNIAMDKLKDIYKFFSRSENTLESEREDTILLDPRSSLLTIGRVPIVNFLQNFHHFLSNEPSPLMQPRPYQMSCKNTWGQPSVFPDGEVVVSGEATHETSGFDTSFLEEKANLLKFPLYIDLSLQTYEITEVGNSLSHSAHTTRAEGSPLQPSPPQLIVPTEEDCLSHESAAFHTPVSELSPSSSNDGEGVKSSGEWVGKVSHITTGFNKRFSDSAETSDLDISKRTSSQQSFSSANSLTISKELSTGVKALPSATISEMTAVSELPTRTRSESPSLVINLDTENSRKTETFHGASWHEQISSDTDNKMVPYEQLEESQSAGFGQFGSSSALESSTVELLSNELKPGLKKPCPLPKHMVSNGHTSPELFHSPIGGPPCDVFSSEQQHESLYSPSRQSLTSQLSTLPTYRGPSLVELRGMGRLPLVSAADLVECEHKFKPGRGIFQFCKDNTSIKDLFYCLLHGRPLAIVGKPSDESSIRRIVRLLWMFVPGHSSKQQIITWQDKPLNVKDLSRVKLIGLSNKVTNVMRAHLRKYMSYWDISSGKVYTPTYSGDLLKTIVSRTRDRKNEQAFIAHALSVLLEISMKAYYYYHTYCANTRPSRQTGVNETSARVYHCVQQTRQRSITLQQSLSVKGSDVDIIEYLVDIIREQQLTEWRDSPPGGTPHNDDPVTFKLFTKQCRESTHKAKRPY